MSRYERVNETSGRLFVADKSRLEENPKLPILNGSINIDGIVVYIGLWKRTSKNGTTYYTAEMTYPEDEQSRLKATGKATSRVAQKEAEYKSQHQDRIARDKSRWDSRQDNADTGTGGDYASQEQEDIPF